MYSLLVCSSPIVNVHSINNIHTVHSHVEGKGLLCVHVSVAYFCQCVIVYLTKRVWVKTLVHAWSDQAVLMFSLTLCVCVCACARMSKGASEWSDMIEETRDGREKEKERERTAQRSESGPEAQFHTALKHINSGWPHKCTHTHTHTHSHTLMEPTDHSSSPRSSRFSL